MAKAKITKRSVDSSGRKVYVFKYAVDGRQVFVTIGDHGDPFTPDTARERALEHSYR